MSARGEGRVVSRFGATLLVRLPDGTVRRATARRKLQHVVCGDYVRWEETPGGLVVSAILPRRNQLVRSYFRGQPRTIAANIDQVVVVTAHRPAPDWFVVDKLLVASELLPADALLLHHKIDLPAPAGLDEMLAVYRGIGYPVLDTTTAEPATLDALRAALRGHTSILIGQSGVGKSSLTNLLVPDADARTAELSEKAELGQHTTSVAWLYELPDGGELIDSPGIRDFTPPPMPAERYQHGFREFAPLLGQCRFHNCLHRREPGCAVRAAVEAGTIHPQRYAHYLRLLEEAGEGPGH